MMLIQYKSDPVLDLHGETLEVSDYLIDAFLKDNIKEGKRKVVIIHGNGNILRPFVVKKLKKSKFVKKYNIDVYNSGSTIIELDI